MTEQLIKNIFDEITRLCREYHDNKQLVARLKHVNNMLDGSLQTKTEKEKEPRIIDSNVIIRAVSEYYNIDISNNCQSRNGKITLARQITHYFLDKYTLMKKEDIGKLVGNKHRTTVINSIKTVQDYIDYNKYIRADIEHIESLILSRRKLHIQTLIDNLPRNPYEPIELNDIDVSMNIKTQYDEYDRKVVDYITYDIYTKDGEEILNFDVELNPGKERELFSEIENRIN
jgi:hypothetical protein